MIASPLSTFPRSLQLADELADKPYSWPGCYPRYAVTNDGEALCAMCAETERDLIAATDGCDGWTIDRLAINWESKITCANCQDPIESAYSEED